LMAPFVTARGVVRQDEMCAHDSEDRGQPACRLTLCCFRRRRHQAVAIPPRKDATS
jgi:hypothetical protein